MAKNHIPNFVSSLCATLRHAGHQAYPVGGCVRDILLGRTPEDWDVTTSARPEQVQALFLRTVPTGIAHGTVTVLLEEERVEVTTFRQDGDYADGRHPRAVTFGGGLEADLSRRDFTINAMALDEEGRVLDFCGGQVDLMARLVRCVGEPDCRFKEDALRMLRGVRFAAQLGFELAEETASAMRRNAHRAAALSGERVRSELEKTLLSPCPQWVGVLVELGLLEHLFANWPARVDWSRLGRVQPTQHTRWREFCALTGFPIGVLPVERALRRAVEHPEVAIRKTLQLTGGDLCALGLQGVAVGAMQRRLAVHVMAYPTDNERERLLALAVEWHAGGQGSGRKGG